VKKMAFERLNRRFGIGASQVPIETETALANIEERKQVLTSAVDVAKTTGQLPSLRDQEYMLFELKDLIQCSKEALYELKKVLKPGTSARAWEVFGKVADSITGQLRELRELNKTMLDIMVFSGTGQAGQQEDKGIQMTGTQLIDLINRARESSEIAKVEAVFDIGDIEGKGD
jgi:hypothetical protein